MIDWKRVGFSTSMKGFGSLIRTEGPKDHGKTKEIDEGLRKSTWFVVTSCYV